MLYLMVSGVGPLLGSGFWLLLLRSDESIGVRLEELRRHAVAARGNR
jgi:hypothetical protein